MAYYDKKNKNWRARCQINGIRISKSGFTSKKNAEVYEALQKVNYERGLLGYSVETETEIETLFLKYENWITKNKTPKSANRDKASFKVWRNFFQDHSILHVEKITPELINNRFIESRSNQRTRRGTFPSKRTINLDLITLRTCLKWAKKNGLISKIPVDEFIFFKLGSLGTPRYLEIEEIKLIESRASKELRSAISVLVRTGMRSGELCSIAPGQINFEKQIIVLPPTMTKAKRERSVPFCDKVAIILQELVKQAHEKSRNYVFCTRTGSQQTIENLLRRFRNLLTRLDKEGLMQNTDKVKIHTLRATYISHKIMNGDNPPLVMEIVGHQDWETTKRYFATHPDYVNRGKPPQY